MKEASAPARKIIVVSNRLPFTIERENGAIQFKASAGGVATGLKSLLDGMPGFLTPRPEYLWVGWPGGAVAAEDRAQVQARALAEFRSHAVFLSEQDFDNFYEGFCNKTIWPLFHYFPQNATYDENYWRQYVRVNEVFAESLLEVVGPEDIVWVHDYHLMLLPELLRKQRPHLKIGFFLHIPFPQFEIYRLLPASWRRALLEGLLGADLVGFHTHDYMEYFLRCVQRVIGFKHRVGHVRVGSRVVRVGAFPMGIDYKKFNAAARSPEGRKKKEELKKSFGENKVIVSVDRQDYSKGILHRLQGFEAMLERAPEWHHRVILLMIVVPSRIGIQDYEGMKQRIEELVGKINGRFGAIDWVPIIYHYRSVPFETLAAVYSMSDVALVTPLRDGMNLVAKEYVACRADGTGVLILSEMAGAAKELAEAIIVNPNHRDEIADALKTALEMPPRDQIRRNRVMQNRLRRADVAHWAMDFIRELDSAESAEAAEPRPLTPAARAGLLRHYERSARRLLLLDYDGTLAPFVAQPALARPSAELLELLRRLSADPRNEIALVSGRSRATIEEWFGALPIGLVAEHGAWIREAAGAWELIKSVTTGWKTKLLPMLKSYADRVPGTSVEEKEFSIVWHYRNAAAERGAHAASELSDDLLAFTTNIDVHVVQANKSVEVRSGGVHKGVAAAQWLGKGGFDFVLAVGDDQSDEDIFGILPERAYSIRVGPRPTRARFSVLGPADVLDLVKRLAKRGEREALMPPADRPIYH
jgi:trehalose 6-phosphate synthase/phosphatase